MFVVKFLAISLVVYAACAGKPTISTSPSPVYIIGDNLDVIAALDSVSDGDVAVIYDVTTVDTVTIGENKATGQTSVGTVTGVTVDISNNGQIKVTKTSLAAGDDGKVITFDHQSVNEDDETYTIAIGCPPITGTTGTADHRSVTGSTGTGCDVSNYNLKGCVTKFACVHGYYADSTPVSSTCVDLNVGEWSVALPTCEAITCDGITAPSDGTSSCTGSSNAHGSSCTIECKSGFSLTTGTSTVTCGDGSGTSGAWSDSEPPVCTAITCDGIAAPSDGTSSCTGSSNAHGSSCTIECNSGFSLSAGTATVTCGDGSGTSGTWSDSTEHACTAITCDGIAAPSDGTSSCTDSSNAHGSSCTIECNSGFSLSAGTATVTCGDGSGTSGAWSDSETPVCTAITCTALAPENADVTCTDSTNYNSECTVACNTGFSSTVGVATVTCTDGTGITGAWDDTTAHVCTAITCTALTPENADVTCTDSTNYNSACTVACNTGFSLTAGVATVTCSDGTGINGAWDDTTAHVCTATSCPVIAAPTNGASACTSGTSAKDDTCAITCVSGYSLTAGTASITCNDEEGGPGEWSDTTEPVCTATACPEIPAPTNGDSTCTSGTSAKDATCTISCSSGYLLTAGTASLTCQDSTDSAGKWSDATPPVCTAITCEKIPNPDGGNSTCAESTTPVGSECTISCGEGLKLNGTGTVTCEEDSGKDGKWSEATDAYFCSGAGELKFALNVMVASVLGAIYSFMI